MLHIALYQPEIPPNTGNIIRLCANAGCILHLIHPLGFDLNDKHVQRAGLDYHELANVIEHANYAAFSAYIGSRRVIACTTKATRIHSDFGFQDEDVLLMGPESRGLPTEIRETIGIDYCIRIPMRENNRSLNLSNATAIILYEAWRQLEYQ